ncbi:MAG TPA: hypothetical protein VGX50_22030, partial [Longimicrobium sp.]|nr:hypothetical protein [Longimicrobium sp.]
MRRSTFLMFVVVPSVLCGVAISRLSGTRARMEPLQEMARMRPRPGFAARISIPTAYHGCTPTPPAVAESIRMVSTQRCRASDEGSLDLVELAGAGRSTDPDSLQASALAAMIWPDNVRQEALDDAIARLERAYRLSPGAALLVDLSAAYLLRAERMQYPRDLHVAREHALQALKLEPRNEAALYNVALALQEAALDEAADRAWDAYLAVDSTSSWADEARLRKRALTIKAAEIRYPGPGASEPVVTEFARLYPQEAREYGWNQVLGTWGAAAAGGDSACAASYLELAELLGGALERRRGGDGSLADAVRAIRQAQSDGDASRVLARAHRAYAMAQQHFQKQELLAAAELFERVVRARPRSFPLSQWATLFLRAAERRGGEVTMLLAEVDSARHPAMTGWANMVLGRSLFGSGHYDSARVQFRSAELNFLRAGETELTAAAWTMQGELAYELGDTLAAYRLLHQAHRTLRPYRRSLRLRNQLNGLAQTLFRDGMRAAALPVFDEDVLVAKRTGAAAGILDAFQGRARARLSIGDLRGADQDLDSAAAWSGELRNEKALREWAISVMR